MKIILIIAATMILASCEDATLSASESAILINKCLDAGGDPIPVYDPEEPTNVYAIQCSIDK